MSKKLCLLIERRNHLVARAASQRLALAVSIAPWRTPLARVDRGLMVLRYLKQHPAWLIGGGLVLAAFRPVRIGSWLGRGWLAWKVMRQLSDK
ncbi:hypothetical protein SFSGTM_26460 [Sulfuriferula nivalis]|uniref:YqjK-like protein n=1 Tax=Sulfuriferula nivalis TaxID=2675298 RepID=A0A809S4K8_9PROT|nr:YqjK-like family protein [Sulfuriferula nivalis]BBP01938.1 hypothetical protein SFSGTM_26460 [Sulfuriferula nivalis]